MALCPLHVIQNSQFQLWYIRKSTDELSISVESIGTFCQIFGLPRKPELYKIVNFLLFSDDYNSFQQ